MDFNIEYLKEHGWPTWLTAIFPMTVIYYKPKRPRQRKKHLGWNALLADEGSPSKYIYSRRYGNYKKASTRSQNLFSYATCCLMGPGDYMTVRRSLKHKGYSKLIGMVYPTEEEIARSLVSWRYIFSKYKSVEEIYRSRGIFTPEMQDLIERLDQAYPSKATGQLRLW